jgi:DNA ligase (NAD+)
MVSVYNDLFRLNIHENEIIKMEGFGKKSYENLIANIESAKDTALPNFIYALGIRHVGLANAKLLCTHFKHDAQKIASACKAEDYMEILLEIKGFGEAIAQSLHTYFSQEKNFAEYTQALEIIRLAIPETPEGERPLDGLTFVITGDVSRFKNRKELQQFIETNGGRTTGSVTAKTSFLINNDALSPSSKNKKAASLNIPILTEDTFMTRFFENS